MDKLFHLTFYDGCNYLSLLGLKLNHVSKRRPSDLHQHFWCWSRTISVKQGKCHCNCFPGARQPLVLVVIILARQYRTISTLVNDSTIWTIAVSKMQKSVKFIYLVQFMSKLSSVHYCRAFVLVGPLNHSVELISEMDLGYTYIPQYTCEATAALQWFLLVYISEHKMHSKHGGMSYANGVHIR